MMDQSHKLVPINPTKPSNQVLTSLQNQASINSISNKLLSPFTWSNINLKLPKVSKKTTNITTIQQKSIKKKPNIKQRSYMKQKARLKQMYFTIDGEKLIRNGSLNEQADPIHQIKFRYRKQSRATVFKSTTLDMHEKHKAINPEKVNQYKIDLITKHLEKRIPRNQSPKQQLNKTSFHLSRLRSPIQTLYKQSSFCSPQTFHYNKIQTYIYRGLAKNNWSQITLKDHIIIPQLLWTDTYLQTPKLKKDQLNNHIKNAHFLTSKNNLHQLQSATGTQYYPQSYQMPFQYQNFCEQYEQQIIKICLKDIIKNCYNKTNAYKKIQRHLGQYLQQVNSKANLTQDTIMIIRLCLYLQNYRKIKNYRYFEHSQSYIVVQTRLQLSVLTILLKACYQYWQILLKNQNNPNLNPIACNYFKPHSIQPQALQVLWGYHCMLTKHQPSYQTLTNRNLWIVKPIASSKGAGISLLKNSYQFFTINYDKYQLTNKNKYTNKIIQKYIEQPLLLKKWKQYTDRKFDIRQWVLVTCDSQTNQPLIYIYQNAYCRFSDMKFTYNHYRSQQTKVHLTNYSQSNKTNPQNSILLLSDILSQKLPNLKQKYDKQITKIVVQTIMNAKDIVFQPNRFQLFGYDVIFDTNQKLWLLEINLNPACQASRSLDLEKIADNMIGDMMKIVKAASGKIGIQQKMRKQLSWKLVYGQQKFNQVDLSLATFQTKVKPFYGISLGQDSLVEQVRKRNFMMNTLSKITINSIQYAWEKLIFNIQNVQEKKNQSLNTIIQQNKEQSQLSAHHLLKKLNTPLAL